MTVKIKKHDIIMWTILLLVGFLSFYTNYMRVAKGFFSSQMWIFLDGLSYTVLSGLIVGYVVVKILKWRK
jgi:hypothetical protein